MTRTPVDVATQLGSLLQSHSSVLDDTAQSVQTLRNDLDGTAQDVRDDLNDTVQILRNEIASNKSSIEELAKEQAKMWAALSADGLERQFAEQCNYTLFKEPKDSSIYTDLQSSDCDNDPHCELLLEKNGVYKEHRYYCKNESLANRTYWKSRNEPWDGNNESENLIKDYCESNEYLYNKAYTDAIIAVNGDMDWKKTFCGAT